MLMLSCEVVVAKPEQKERQYIYSRVVEFHWFNNVPWVIYLDHIDQGVK